MDGNGRGGPPKGDATLDLRRPPFWRPPSPVAHLPLRLGWPSTSPFMRLWFGTLFGHELSERRRPDREIRVKDPAVCANENGAELLCHHSLQESRTGGWVLAGVERVLGSAEAHPASARD